MTTSISPSLTTYTGNGNIAPLTTSDIDSFSQIVYPLGAALGGGGSGGSGYLNTPTNITIGSGTNYSYSNTNHSYTHNVSSGSIKVQGDAEFDGDIKLKGKSLVKMLEQIEQRLAILHPNPDLESRWDELKELAIRYKELEAEIIEKEQIWATLKK